MITQELVKELFTYKNGILYWKISPSNGVKKGDIAGTRSKDTYFRTSIKRRMYSNHRLIFLYHHGYLPKEVDHKDGNIHNNKTENLRGCVRSQNCQNARIQKNNTSGVKGITWHKRLRRWQARIQFNGKRVCLGSFKNINIAEQTIKNERIRLHGVFANHGGSL